MGSSGKDNGFLGGLFDFDGDGKTSMFETFLAYKMFEECTKEDEDEDEDESFDPDPDSDTELSWRDFCDSDPEHGIDPEDYESEEEYEEALREAELRERDFCRSDPEYGAESNDYETEEENIWALSDAEASAASLRHSDETDDEPDGMEPEDSVSRLETAASTPPGKHSLQEYRKRRREFFNNCLITVGAVLLLCTLPALLVWTIISDYDPHSSAGGFVTFIFAAAGLAFIGLVLTKLGYLVFLGVKDFWEDRNLFLKTAPEEDRAEFLSRKRKAALGICLCIGAVLAVIAGVNVVSYVQMRSAYEEGRELIAAGDYPQAKESLLRISDGNYRDTDGLLAFCDGHIRYEAGDLSGAYSALESVDISQLNIGNKKNAVDFKCRVNIDYDRYRREQDRIQTGAYESRIRNGVPYIGMSESRIGDTSLGAPSVDVRHNYECIGGEQYLANLYDFERNGRTVFCARCVRGIVTEVWDDRDRDTSRPPYRPSVDDDDDDPYNAGDYSDEEDFYYDHYDDFFDYYDAEEYYDEHQD